MSAPHDPVRLGIIGLGAQGGMYAKLIGDGKVPHLAIGAICDIDTGKAAIAERYGVPFFDDHLAMLDSGTVDAIVTTVPHYLHPEMGIDAMQRGVHALVEKPAGVYTAQVDELLQVAAATPDLTFAIMFNQRTNPLYVDLRTLLASGELGALRHSSWTITTWWRPQAYYEQSAWRATWGGEGGGVLVNQAPHQLDLWQWLCGVPRSVVAKCSFGFRRRIAVEDEVNALVDFGDGASGSFITATHDIVGTDRLEILCDRGKIVVDDSKTVTITRLSDTEQAISGSMTTADVVDLFRGQADLGRYMTTTTTTYESRWGQQHADVLANFAANIVDGTPLIAPGADGIHGVRLANAIHLSSWLGQEVSITDFDEARYLAELNQRIRTEGIYPERPA
jgi:predicted dehydrogenase